MDAPKCDGCQNEGYRDMEGRDGVQKRMKLWVVIVAAVPSLARKKRVRERKE